MCNYYIYASRLSNAAAAQPTPKFVYIAEFCETFILVWWTCTRSSWLFAHQLCRCFGLLLWCMQILILWIIHECIIVIVWRSVCMRNISIYSDRFSVCIVCKRLLQVHGHSYMHYCTPCNSSFMIIVMQIGKYRRIE